MQRVAFLAFGKDTEYYPKDKGVVQEAGLVQVWGRVITAAQCFVDTAAEKVRVQTPSSKATDVSTSLMSTQHETACPLAGIHTHSHTHACTIKSNEARRKKRRGS